MYTHTYTLYMAPAFEKSRTLNRAPSLYRVLSSPAPFARGSLDVCMCVYIYIYIEREIYVYIYIYIYRYMSLSLYIYIYMHIYIYKYTINDDHNTTNNNS